MFVCFKPILTSPSERVNFRTRRVCIFGHDDDYLQNDSLAHEGDADISGK